MNEIQEKSEPSSLNVSQIFNSYILGFVMIALILTLWLF
jgi:hypothetical protein